MVKGSLYLVGVPIGHYDDMTFRALETLKKVTVIAAEDTRKTQHLLRHFNITPERIYAHHAHNENQSSQGIVALLNEGTDVALVTDAGMPTVSDPGYKLLSVVRKAGLNIKVIPGVSAVPTAIAISGLPSEDFRFIGFLPRKKSRVAEVLEELRSAPSTLVLFESPKRLVITLETLLQFLGNRSVCLCRELTKTHEEVLPTTLENLIDDLARREKILGEVTLVVAGNTQKNVVDEKQLTHLIQKGLKAGKSPKSLRDELSEQFGLSKRELYQKIINTK